MASLLSLPGDQVVTALINAANPKLGVKAEDLTFADPTFNSFNNGRNTTILVGSKGNAKWYGPERFFYDRINLSEKLHNATMGLDDDFTSTEDILAKINASFDLELTLNDVEDRPIATDSEGSPCIYITAKPGNLVYTGSGVVKLKSVNLAVAVTQTDVGAITGSIQ